MARSDRFRIFYLINGLGPGGAERSLAELLPFFLERGIRPTLICMRHREQGVERDVRVLGCEVRFLPPGSLVAKARALGAMARAERADLLHTTLFESDVVGRLAAWRTGIPVLTSLVNTTYEPVRLRDPHVNRPKLLAVWLIDSLTARLLTTHFHAITVAVKDSAVRTLGIPAGRVTVVERGRAPERLGAPGLARRREARRRLGLEDDDELVLTVGRQEYQKGQRYLLQAAQALLPTRPRLRFLVAGREGHASAELRSLHRSLGLEDRVRFLGHRDDVPDLLAAADLFVFPSLYEGLGGALIEAMALGLPVVASDLPALREVVEHGRNGLLVEPEAPEALAAALAHVLDDRGTAAAFGRRSRQIFEERFTLEQSARRMIELYREILAPAGARRPSAVA